MFPPLRQQLRLTDCFTRCRCVEDDWQKCELTNQHEIEYGKEWMRVSRGEYTEMVSMSPHHHHHHHHQKKGGVDDVWRRGPDCKY